MPDIAYLMYTSSGDTSGIKIAYNLGDFQISEPQHVEVPNLGENLRSFHSADLDGNGYNDFALVRFVSYPLQNLEILFNDGYGHFGPDPFVSLTESPTSKSQLFCFPNPFHNNTTFKYYIEKPSQIELVVYTLNGQLISILTNQMQNAGLHSVTWNTQNHAYGTCITCLRLNGKVYKTMKIIGL